MKKKHFLFTSLAIAAILSANVVQAEENTGSVNEPDKELVTGDGVSVALENLLETETGEATSNQGSSGLESEGEAEETPLLADDSATRSEVIANPELSEVTTRSASTPSLDADALKAGDYSSVYGTWESVSGAGSVTFGEFDFNQFSDLPLGESKKLPVLGNDKVYPVYVERRLTEDGHVENITATSSGRTIDWKFVPKGTTYSLEWKKAENLKVAEEDLVLGRMNGEFDYSAYRRSATSPEIHNDSAPETGAAMLVDAIHNGDYRSVQGIWSKVNDAQGQPEFIRLTDNGFFSAPELNFKAVKLGEVKEVPNRYKWGRMIVSNDGYPTDWIGYHNSEGISATYVPKGGTYSLWDVNLGKSVEKIAAEDIIISRGLGYQAVYARAQSVDQFYDVTAGDYGMGTLVDSLGRSIVDNKAVVVTGQLGDTIDLNAVGGRFGREGKAIYRVTLSNGKDELTLPDYQSSFVLDETTKVYTKISIVYDTDMPKPKANDNNSKPDESDKTPDTKEPTIKPNGEVGRPYTAEQELIARVWKTVTGGEYPYFVVKKEAKTPIVGLTGSKVYPKVTYFIAEDTTLTKRSYAMSYEVTFSDNGDGTVTIYKVPKHWHIEDKDVERVTKEILDTAQIIRLEELTEEETGTVIKLATSYTGFTAESPKATSQSSGKEKVVSPKVKGDKGTASTSETKTALPKTGDKSRLATVIAGFGLLLTSLGLAYHRKRS